MKVKWTSSLQTKYILLVFLALLFLPFCLPLISLTVYLPPVLMQDEEDPYQDYDYMEATWHEEVAELSDEPEDVILSRMAEWHERWPDAGMFWVGENGQLKEQINLQAEIPEQWSQGDAVQFMKERYDGELFTVVASLEESNRGFMVIEIDRELLGPPITKLERSYDVFIFIAIAAVFIGFIVLSWVFFRKVQGRLKRLESAMEQRGDNGLPTPVERTSNDEIGMLEVSFNRMVKELEESRERERKEEALRREWIASLSHDLRTPLTTIRASLAEVSREVKSEKGQASLDSINMKIDSLSHLIDNLLSLSLLTSKKYPYHEEQVEMNRFVRRVAAHWYATLEQEGLEVEVDVSQDEQLWAIDSKWMERILDNLFQNVVRHAASGRFIAIRLKQNKLCIEDRGTGMASSSKHEGAGVGLTIVDLMIRDMGLEWQVDSAPDGTTISIENPSTRIGEQD
ncbi:HAMP domain-containing histidine kinase [Halobacillus litoralis]|uniref:sensor histidine kinase n=1 Tax=Halobacillus litoralis TaxID=45668 RepID=UPI001CD6F788|nr:HAMP domain-containing sensor histidine kinase [Halobacillus litoralis]MCA0971078.1 HAMP domain-containing histidine kinase [Halobacillus litoralis]